MHVESKMERVILAESPSADDGSFELSGMMPGTYLLMADKVPLVGPWRSLIVSNTIVVQERDISDMHVAVDTGIKVQGRVYPAKRAYVRLEQEKSPNPLDPIDAGAAFLQTGMFTASDTGEFEFEGVPAGRYRLTAATVEGQGGELLLVAADIDENDLAVQLVHRSPISGRVVDLVGHDTKGAIRGTIVSALGGPESGAWVRALHQACNPNEDEPDDVVLTDRDGQFSMENLSLGHYDLIVQSADGKARARENDVRLGTNVVVTLKSLFSLTAIVRFNGAPVSEYDLLISGATSRRIAHVRADDGRYEIDQLEAGSYYIEVQAASGSARGQVDLAANEQQTLRLDLLAWGSLRGRLVDAVSGEPFGDVDVILSRSDLVEPRPGHSFDVPTARTDVQGNFTIEKVPSGQLAVSFRHPLHGTLSLWETPPNSPTPIGPSEWYSQILLAPGHMVDLRILKATSWTQSFPRRETAR
jgi:hypothetical protein